MLVNFLLIKNYLCIVKTKFNNRYRQLVGVFLLSFLLIAGVFTIFPVIGNKAKTLKWAEWTGFGEDTTRSESVETKTDTGKKTVTTQFQSGKTLWDVLELAGTLAIPVLLTILGIWFQQKEQERAEKKAQIEKDIANENLRDEALQVYIDRLSELLLDRNLILSKGDDPVRDVARTRTLTILRRLGNDAERKARVLHFLYDAGLLEIKSVPLINLKDADFRAADLNSANLNDSDLNSANLNSANLIDADLSGANLNSADLNSANLRDAVLVNANLIDADLSSAHLNSANLNSADLRGAVLFNADLIDTDLSFANLSGAVLINAVLINAVLINADLSLADLSFANLRGADLRGANLSGAYLTDADLTYADLTNAVLVNADLSSADLTDTKSLTPEQVEKAMNWKKANYSEKFRIQLGLPPGLTK